MIGHLGQTEVADHDLGVLVRTVVQQVLRLQTDETTDVNDVSLKTQTLGNHPLSHFQVSVDDAVLMQVGNGLQDLFDHTAGVFFRVNASI